MDFVFQTLKILDLLKMLRLGEHLLKIFEI